MQTRRRAVRTASRASEQENSRVSRNACLDEADVVQTGRPVDVSVSHWIDDGSSGNPRKSDNPPSHVTWTEGGPPHAARQIPRPTARRQLRIYMCCAVCALLLGGSRHHKPAGGIRRFRDARVSHSDAFGACKLLGSAPLYHHSPSARFRRPAASDLASDPYVRLPAG